MVGKRIFHKRSMRKAPLKSKTVLVRADYNVPMSREKIDDDFRIRSSLPTIKRLLADKCKVVVISHLGRPDGKRDLDYSLEPVAQRLAELLSSEVRFVDDCVGEKTRMAVRRAPMNSVVVLENLRFHPEEEENDEAFAKKIAHDTCADYFVQDGFGVVHRAHASTDAITRFLPSVAGLLLEREYEQIVGAMNHPARPLVALLGGAKVSDKIQVINRLVKVADQIIIGGAMANTFLAFNGHRVGKSKVETDQNQVVENIYDLVAKKVSSKYRDNFLVLPTDVAVAKTIDENSERRTVSIDEVAEDDFILDIGDRSIERMVAALRRAQTVIWNGTLGVAELPEFAHGSARAALELAQSEKKVSIIGGGDTADFVLHWEGGSGDSFTHVSTGGGASLELMSGKQLPGVEALLDA